MSLKVISKIVLLALALNSVAPVSSAQAGVIMAGQGVLQLTGVLDDEGGIDGGEVHVAFGAGMALVNGLLVYALCSKGTVGSYIGLAFMVLDADGSLSQSKIEEGLSQRYPFIDNADVIHNLAQALKRKYDGMPVKMSMIHMTETETREILAESQLTDDQTSKVIGDLI